MQKTANPNNKTWVYKNTSNEKVSKDQ